MRPLDAARVEGDSGAGQGGLHACRDLRHVGTASQGRLEDAHHFAHVMRARGTDLGHGVTKDAKLESIEAVVTTVRDFQ